MRIAHVVVTDAFAGTERYVADVAVATSALGHDVVVLGGSSERMRDALGKDVAWAQASAPLSAIRALARSGRFDIVHAHLTNAEAAAAVTRPRHKGRVIATRHIARRRGSSPAGRLLRRSIARRIDREIAISRFVATAAGLPPSAVLHNGVRSREPLWREDAHTVVIAQRLEIEKDTMTGLQAWRQSGLIDRGWRLVIAGDGAERKSLEAAVEERGIGGVAFLGEVADMASLWSSAGILLATAPAEPLGLSVLEAMSVGVPVVAAAAGGHLETAGRLSTHGNVFPPRDAAAAARGLVRLGEDPHLRESVGRGGAQLQRREFDLDRHAAGLIGRYHEALSG